MKIIQLFFHERLIANVVIINANSVYTVNKIKEKLTILNDGVCAERDWPDRCRRRDGSPRAHDTSQSTE